MHVIKRPLVATQDWLLAVQRHFGCRAGSPAAALLESVPSHPAHSNPPAPSLLGEGLALPPELAEAKAVVLLVLDGLGWHLLQEHLPQSHLLRHCRGKLRTTFPSTTSAAITSLMTGAPPAQHGHIGWHTYFPELDAVWAGLPMKPRRRVRGAAKTADGFATPDLEALFPYPSLFSQLNCRSTVISPASIAHSPFNLHHSRGATLQAYAQLQQLPDLLRQAVKGAPSLTYAYVGDFDHTAHHYGCHSAEARACAIALDALFNDCLCALAGTETLLCVTADHGFIDIDRDNIVELSDHPVLQDCLAQPLWGEWRASFATVRVGRENAFESYINQQLSAQLTWHRSADLAAAGWFGTPIHPRLLGRIGTHVLLPKGNGIVRDWLTEERPYELIGVHGGISDAEMDVPLILVKC